MESPTYIQAAQETLLWNLHHSHLMITTPKASAAQPRLTISRLLTKPYAIQTTKMKTVPSAFATLAVPAFHHLLSTETLPTPHHRNAPLEVKQRNRDLRNHRIVTLLTLPRTPIDHHTRGLLLRGVEGGNLLSMER